jgi:cytidylate kinase
MEKKHIITIAGKLGSGKSSTTKKVAEMLDYKHYSTGGMMRDIANEKGILLEDLSFIAEQDGSIDKALDDYNLEIGKMENIVLDSRLGFHFIPNSFKVFIELDPKIAARRILLDKKENSNRQKEATGNFDTEEDIAEKVEERLLSERKRYKELYNIEDHTDHKNFDFIIDSENLPIEEVSIKIIKEYNDWLNNK